MWQLHEFEIAALKGMDLPCVGHIAKPKTILPQSLGTLEPFIFWILEVATGFYTMFHIYFNCQMTNYLDASNTIRAYWLSLIWTASQTKYQGSLEIIPECFSIFNSWLSQNIQYGNLGELKSCKPKVLEAVNNQKLKPERTGTYWKPSVCFKLM